MTAATLTELTVKNLPATTMYGTPLRRCMVFIRTATAMQSKTIALDSYIPGVADVEGIISQTDDNVRSGTAFTWSTTTVTIPATVTGVVETCLVCTLT
jgi:hypothetical protein